MIFLLLLLSRFIPLQVFMHSQVQEVYGQLNYILEESQY
nr:MAG TPA: hypothetical protein [Bacteriophage sp.]